MKLFPTYILNNFPAQIHADLDNRVFLVYEVTQGCLVSRLNDHSKLLVDDESAHRILNLQ